MRVISGKAKGHKLKMVPGDSTRPITDRVKENLFNILGDWVIGTIWIDLFAGTGQVGIEAISRGAEHTIFVDSARQAVQTIRNNLAHTNFTNSATVVQGDAFSYLERAGDMAVDVIYVAPPQYQELWTQVLDVIDTKLVSALKPQGLVIVQIDPAEYIELALTHFSLNDQRPYGRTMLCFYERSDV
jgi:16S rRNA (guanine(966)-N(2))-methyltransferase RsmD